jgi:hypothetical protein
LFLLPPVPSDSNILAVCNILIALSNMTYQSWRPVGCIHWALALAITIALLCHELVKTSTDRNFLQMLEKEEEKRFTDVEATVKLLDPTADNPLSLLYVTESAANVNPFQERDLVHNLSSAFKLFSGPFAAVQAKAFSTKVELCDLSLRCDEAGLAEADPSKERKRYKASDAAITASGAGKGMGNCAAA